MRMPPELWNMPKKKKKKELIIAYGSKNITINKGE